MSTMDITREAPATARSATPARKPHLRELDRLRIITALSVVAVHVLGNSTFLDPTPGALAVQNAVVTGFHFTREVFMFVTALALVYVYYDKPFDTGRFWRKRALGVLLPYVVWSLIYVIVNDRPTSIAGFVGTSLLALVTGNAMYQLYYILLTLEFYLIFPWFLRILPRLARHLWTTLIVSFTLELVILFLDHQVLPGVRLPPAIGAFIGPFFDRFVLVYQFYFVLGAIVALHLPEIKAFLLRRRGWVISAGVAALVALEANYFIQLEALGQPMRNVVSVLQPMMAPYSLGAIAFLYWLALTLAARATPTADRLWATLSDAAFGVYLIHPLFIGAFLAVLAPPLRTRLPVALLVALVWALTAACSVTATMLLLKIPGLSRIMGRPASSAPTWIVGWLVGWRARLGALGDAAVWRKTLALERPIRSSSGSFRADTASADEDAPSAHANARRRIAP